jgi:chromosome segregation ATPase
VHTLEAQAGLVSRDKEAVVEALEALRKENDAQQSNWEDLRRTNEQLEQLATLVSQQAQTNEPELRRARDRTKVLEGEYASLQRRYKEQETRVTSSERSASTARASLAQAQQRAAEWEDRANENEVALEEAQAARDQAEDSAAQLEAEYSLLRMQLDEKDAEERLAKVGKQTVCFFYCGN